MMGHVHVDPDGPPDTARPPGVVATVGIRADSKSGCGGGVDGVCAGDDAIPSTDGRRVARRQLRTVSRGQQLTSPQFRRARAAQLYQFTDRRQSDTPSLTTASLLSDFKLVVGAIDSPVSLLR
jgi:hypothetical protein